MTQIRAFVWRKFPQNPVLDVVEGTWEEGIVGDPWVLVEDGVLKMWYYACGQGKCQTGLAVSPDGVRWERHPSNPVIRAESDFDRRCASKVTVVKRRDIYHAWYGADDGKERTIAYATSRDGINWEKHGVVLRPEMDFEGKFLDCPSALWDEERKVWRMWYSAGQVIPGEPHVICYAESRDGRNWRKHPGNPILVPSGDGSWFGRALGGCQVLKVEGGYLMFLNAFDERGISRAGYATSPDGLSWSISPSPLIDLGKKGEFDDAMVFRPHGVFVKGVWMIWYNGKSSEDGKERIGLIKGTPKREGEKDA